MEFLSISEDKIDIFDFNLTNFNTIDEIKEFLLNEYSFTPKENHNGELEYRFSPKIIDKHCCGLDVGAIVVNIYKKTPYNKGLFKHFSGFNLVQVIDSKISNYHRDFLKKSYDEGLYFSTIETLPWTLNNIFENKFVNNNLYFYLRKVIKN